MAAALLRKDKEALEVYAACQIVFATPVAITVIAGSFR